MYWTRNSMNNFLSHCGLVATRISASDKDLPVKRDKKELTTVGFQINYVLYEQTFW